MRHLIIGSGNMGKKHAATLVSLRQSVDMVDIGWEGSADISKYDSVIITTPPQTHESIYSAVKTARAVFIEKPVFVDRSSTPRTFGPTMVACNWRFCGCVGIPSVIEVGYPTRDPFWKMDMIHFSDLFEEHHGPPSTSSFLDSGDRVRLMLENPAGKMALSVQKTTGDAYSRVNGKAIHDRPCGMFAAQWEHWLYCLRFGLDSCNPIEVAVARTNRLLDAMKHGGGVYALQ